MQRYDLESKCIYSKFTIAADTGCSEVWHSQPLCNCVGGLPCRLRLKQKILLMLGQLGDLSCHLDRARSSSGDRTDTEACLRVSMPAQ